MESQVTELVVKLWHRYIEKSPSERLLIGIAGIPGSGKTSLARHLVSRLNTLSHAHDPSSPAPATCVFMDGFHYTRAQLDAMPDPREAHRRRGAAFTFDADAYAGLIAKLRAPIEAGRDVLAPSFDHAIKDPVADDVVVRPEQRIVVIEGLYVALAVEPWSRAARMLDVVVFVEVDEAVATERLVKRHMEAGIVQTEEEGLQRAKGSDLVNGREIVAKIVDGVKLEILVSKYDDEWAKNRVDET